MDVLGWEDMTFRGQIIDQSTSGHVNKALLRRDGRCGLIIVMIIIKASMTVSLNCMRPQM
jgi:hypothetical protein